MDSVLKKSWTHWDSMTPQSRQIHWSYSYLAWGDIYFLVLLHLGLTNRWTLRLMYLRLLRTFGSCGLTHRLMGHPLIHSYYGNLEHLEGSSAVSKTVGVISLNWPANSKIFYQMFPKLAQMLVIPMVLNGHLFYLYRLNNTLTILC